MRSRLEVRRTIDDVLIPYADCVAWSDFGPNGNPCYNSSYFSSVAEEEEAAYTLAAVTLEMKKGSYRHLKLAKKVAAETGNKFVTYPWIRETVSRLLTGSSYEELLSMSMLSRKVKDGMKVKGLAQISSIEEALT